MSTYNNRASSYEVDLGKYVGLILSSEDRPLFEDAVKAGQVGALRAAYLVIWLSCAESLKRRFREAQTRDSAAGKIVGQIEGMEQSRRSVDTFLVDKARDYGFISDTEHAQLLQIYDNRCIYGHPYETAPSPEKVTDAAATVVDVVLSRPVKFRHGYAQRLVTDLLTDTNYLDDQMSPVTEFAKTILPNLDESVHGWLLDKYWNRLESMAGDASVALFFRRGTWFTRAIVRQVGVEVFNADEWHAKVLAYPRTTLHVCSVYAIFTGIGDLAQDSLVGSILSESKTTSRVLAYLEQLDNLGPLSDRHRERFVDRVSELSMREVAASGLHTKTCYDRLVKGMRSHNWYQQNPAINFVASNGPEQAAELAEDQLVNLGRNILQSAEGHSASAIEFLEDNLAGGKEWPLGIVRGVVLETFSNERNEVRLKVRCLDSVLRALNDCNCEQRNDVVGVVVKSIQRGVSTRTIRQEEFESTIERLSSYTWAEPLTEALRQKSDDVDNL